MISKFDVWNSFMQNTFTAKSNDCMDLLSVLQTFNAYIKIGIHLHFKRCITTSSEANLPNSLRTTNRPWKGRGQGHVTTFRILHDMKYLQNGQSYSLQILCTCWLSELLTFTWQIVPEMGVVKARDVLNFWQISVNISKTVQDRDILSMEDYRKSYMAYRMAPVLVTLNDLEGHFPRSFLVCWPFQVQSVVHLRSILPDFNWQRYMTNCPPNGRC